MSVCTGEFKIVYPLTAYAEADTYYTTTPLTLYRGADSIRLTLTNTVANAGNVTIKAQILQGDGVTYADYGNTMVVAMTTAIVQSVVLPFRFVTGDMVRISFKASSVASSPKLQIDALAYLDGTDYRNSEIPQTITTVADTPNPITAQSRNKTNIYGSASNSKMVLPSGLTVTNDWTHTFWNLSSEFVPVTDYDGTLQAMVGPGCKLECVLKTAGTAAGVWVCTLDDSELRKFDEDFVDGYSTGTAKMRVVSGTGSGQTNYNVLGQFGSAFLSLGTDPAGYVLMTAAGYTPAAASALLNEGKPYMFRHTAMVQQLSDGTDTYSYRAGFLTATDGAEPAAGVYFETDADGDIVGITRAASTSTPVTGGGKIKLVSTATNSDMLFVVNSAATRIDFWVDNTYLGKSESNIPKATAMCIQVQYDRVAGTAASRFAYADRVLVGRPK